MTSSVLKLNCIIEKCYNYVWEVLLPREKEETLLKGKSIKTNYKNDFKLSLKISRFTHA